MIKPKITVTVRWLLDNWLWEDYCEAAHVNVWALNEGRIDSDQVVEIPSSLMPRVVAILIGYSND